MFSFKLYSNVAFMQIFKELFDKIPIRCYVIIYPGLFNYVPDVLVFSALLTVVGQLGATLSVMIVSLSGHSTLF